MVSNSDWEVWLAYCKGVQETLRNHVHRVFRRELRALTGPEMLPRKSLARFLGVSEAAISRWLAGENSIKLENLLGVISAAGVRLEEFDLSIKERKAAGYTRALQFVRERRGKPRREFTREHYYCLHHLYLRIHEWTTAMYVHDECRRIARQILDAAHEDLDLDEEGRDSGDHRIDDPKDLSNLQAEWIEEWFICSATIPRIEVLLLANDGGSSRPVELGRR